jgi:DNA repair exonuclease SbcCD ATPase subunit
MKQIQFKKIGIQNFLSIGEPPLILPFSPGINIITGQNYDIDDSRNGVGKTCIVDAIFYVLFGETLRDLKKDQIVNFSNKKNCEVILDFDISQNNTIDHYQIIRGINPSKCILFKNDQDISKSTIIKTTNYILDLFKASSTLFKHSIVMSINNTLPFLSLKKIERRKFIESIMQLEVFGEMLSLTNKDLNTYKKNKDIELVKLDENQKVLGSYISQQSIFQKSKQERINRLKERLDKILSDIYLLKASFIVMNIENQIDILNHNLLQFNELDKKIQDKLNNNISKESYIKSNISHIEKEIETIKNLGEVCITCKRKFESKDFQSQKDQIKLLEDQISNYKKEQNDLIDKRNQLNAIRNQNKEKISSAQEQIQKINLDINKNKETQLKIDHHNEIIKQINIDIQKIEEEKDNLGELIQNTQKNISDFNLNLTKIDKEISNTEVAKFILSEEGLKSVIVKKTLSFLNNNLNHYLKRMESNCVCSFDEYFDDKITNIKGVNCSYSNFSGGETKRIDLSMLFTFMELRRILGNISFNISIFDELFDSSIDAKGTKLVLDILKDRVNKYNECIYIITHRQEAIKSDKIDNIIELEKRNGFTKLKGDNNGP